MTREIKETLAKYRALEAPKAGGLKESVADSNNGYGSEAGCGLRRDMGSQDHRPLPPLTPRLPFSLTPSFAHSLSCLTHCMSPRFPTPMPLTLPQSLYPPLLSSMKACHLSKGNFMPSPPHLSPGCSPWLLKSAPSTTTHHIHVSS